MSEFQRSQAMVFKVQVNLNGLRPTNSKILYIHDHTRFIRLWERGLTFGLMPCYKEIVKI